MLLTGNANEPETGPSVLTEQVSGLRLSDMQDTAMLV